MGTTFETAEPLQLFGSASVGAVGLRPLSRKRLGLYHTALLLPRRADLASFAEHLRLLGMFAASSDHLVSEAFYLNDRMGSPSRSMPIVSEPGGRGRVRNSQ